MQIVECSDTHWQEVGWLDLRFVLSVDEGTMLNKCICALQVSTLLGIYAVMQGSGPCKKKSIKQRKTHTDIKLLWH